MASYAHRGECSMECPIGFVLIASSCRDSDWHNGAWRNTSIISRLPFTSLSQVSHRSLFHPPKFVLPMLTIHVCQNPKFFQFQRFVDSIDASSKEDDSFIKNTTPLVKKSNSTPYVKKSKLSVNKSFCSRGTSSFGQEGDALDEEIGCCDQKVDSCSREID